MAIMVTDGLVDIEKAFDDIALISDDVQADMINAAADIVVTTTKHMASTYLKGPYYKGGVANSVRKKTPRKYKDGMRCSVAFEGTQHGNRVSEIAYINEYGKTNQPARPFIWGTIERCSHAAYEAAYRIYDRALKKIFKD